MLIRGRHDFTPARRAGDLGAQRFGAILLGARIEDISGEDARAFARVLGAQMGQAIGLSRSFASLAASEQRYRTLTENANDAIVILSRDGVIRETNRRLTEILGYTTGELIGRQLRELTAPGPDRDNIATLDERVRAGVGRSDPLELKAQVRRHRADRALERERVNLGGEPHVLIIGRDVTDQVHAQAQLMVSDRMASVGALAAGVAHEINNPLAAVFANVELAVEDAALLAGEFGATPRITEALARSLHDAREAADRVKQIVKRSEDLFACRKRIGAVRSICIASSNRRCG